MWISPYVNFFFYFNNLMGQGADKVSMGMWLCNRSRVSAEKGVGPQLCLLVPTLGCQFG